ncbi:MAG: Ppx/GppA phosphatase family protein [Dokdonella sp.]
MTTALQIHDGEVIAAVDLGSNSFHLVVARYQDGELRVIDRLRDSVRMAMGLRADRSLDQAHLDRALTTLARFGQRLSGLPHDHVHAVATNSVRQLARPQEFLLPAELALGHPIEVVSGREEARLIYLGVAHGLPRGLQRRLVIDIGGGSTEFIIGQDFETLERESLQMGCVASTLRFFADGKYTDKRWRQALTEIEVELQQFAADYRSRGWVDAIGSSGTARAIEAICVSNGWSEVGVTPEALKQLRAAIIAAGSVEKLALPGLGDDRVAVIAGGTVILEAAFNALGITRMTVCETAMREGLLYDMLGRASDSDPRAGSINALAKRYNVDKEQALRVRETAQMLFDQVASSWNLGALEREVLGWCADIHEVGLAIAHSQHHQHGAYIVGNSDLAGFTRQGQQVVATIIRSHRRKPQRAQFEALPARFQRDARSLTGLLRLAALLQRGRSNDSLPVVCLDTGERSLKIVFPDGWLNRHPLTRADLEQERDYFKQLDIKLQVA